MGSFPRLFAVYFFRKAEMKMDFDVAIIGAGVIGSMCARELSRYNLKVCVLEKNSDIAMGASRANSGIVHGGFDPEPDTLKAKMNVSGVEKLFSAARELCVHIKRNGSFVCAFSEQEDLEVKKLYERGIQNGVPGMEIISGDEARKMEPHLSEKITSVLNVTNAGIVCPYDLTIAAIGNAMDNGVELKCEFEVSRISKKNSKFIIRSKNGESINVKYIINCAGGYSDKIARLIGDDSFEIIPRAGEYLLLDKTEGARVERTIFKVPSKEGKGILVSPTVDGNLLVGPTASVVESPESTNTTQIGIDTVIALSKNSVPDINFRSVITSFCGVRSSEKNGDFIIEPSSKDENFINVAAIDSPGLSSCVSIAEYVVEILKGIGVELEKNESFDPNRENMHFFREMNDDEKNEYIKTHPEYGKIVCRCECVSEGEIRKAIKTNPPAKTIDGVKRRTRSGMGRCQGGFCGPSVMKLIAEENGIEKKDVTKSGKGSEMIFSKL